MNHLNYVTRGGSNPQGKPKVFFSAHPGDTDCLGEVEKLILDRQDCVFFWLESDPGKEEEREHLFNLSLMQLLVVPVTTKLLTSRNRAKDTDIPFALAHHIPVLPLMYEPGLEQLFNKTIGNIQFLVVHDTDVTAISFGEKLSRFLDSVLVGDGMQEKIREAFDAYIFLSYRKKDRHHANRLIKLIHDNPEYRDIAIWYDEFLVPGDNFNDAIRNAMEKSEIFALAVTPQILEADNYVMRVEYPVARQRGITILPVEMHEPKKNDPRVDMDQLEAEFRGIGRVEDEQKKEEVHRTLSELRKRIPRKEPDPSPEEKLQHAFLIGLAYLNGIDTETDYDRAFRMISSCADENYLPALDQLVLMYENGKGVGCDYYKAAETQGRIAGILESQYKANSGDEEKLQLLISALCSFGDRNRELMRWEQAEEAYARMLAYCETGRTPMLRRYAAVGHSLLGAVYQAQNRFDDAAASYEKAGSIRKELPKSPEFYPETAESENRLAELYMAAGKPEPAGEHYRAMVDILREYRRARQTPEAGMYLCAGLNGLGAACMAAGNFSEAERCLREDLEISSRLAEELRSPEGDRNYNTSLQTAGDLYMELGNTAQAEEFYRKALEISEKLYGKTGAIGDCRSLGIDCEKMSDLSLRNGDPEGAKRWLMRAKELAEHAAELADTPQTHEDAGTVYFKIGQLMEECGQLQDAEEYYLKSRDSAGRAAQDHPTAGIRRLQANITFALGSIAENRDDLPAARKHYLEALKTREELAEEAPTLNNRRDLGVSCHALGDLALAEGDITDAEEFCRRGYRVMLGIHRDSGTAETAADLAVSLDRLGNLMKKKGETGEAGEYYMQALSLRQANAEKDPSAQYRDSLAVSHYKLGILERSRTHLEEALGIWAGLCEECPDSSEYRRQRDIVRKKLNDLDLMESLSSGLPKPEKKRFLDRFRKK